MKRLYFTSLILLTASIFSAYAQSSSDLTAVGNAVATGASALQTNQQTVAQIEAQQAALCTQMDTKGFDCATCSSCKEDVKAVKASDCASGYSLNGCTKTPKIEETIGFLCAESSEDIKKNIKKELRKELNSNEELCKSYLEAGKAKVSLLQAITALTGIALQIGGIALAPGCEEKCEGLSGKALTRCACQSVDKDGLPCLNPSSSECMNLDKKTCSDEEILEAYPGVPAGDLAYFRKVCECGMRAELDPGSGWHIDENSNCISKWEAEEEELRDGGKIDYAKLETPAQKLEGIKKADAEKAKSDPAKGSSATALKSGAKASGDKKADAKAKERPDFSKLAGGAKGATGMGQGGSDSYYSGSDKKEADKKKAELAKKEIAKADSKTVFELVNDIYTAQITANALDSMRLDVKTKSKKGS